MHQVFLGIGKNLTKLMFSLVNDSFLAILDNLIFGCKVPEAILHRLKRAGEVQF